MAVFNLSTFPNVCRACLQSLHPGQLVALDTYRPLFDCTIRTFLQDITFQVSETIVPFLPSVMCLACLEVMEFFFKYRSKMMHLHEFLVALVRVKFGDTTHLKKLFHTQTEELELFFRDLDLCNKANPTVEDLLDEYDQYTIASMSLEEQQLALDQPTRTDPSQQFTVHEEETNSLDADQSYELFHEDSDTSNSAGSSHAVSCKEEFNEPVSERLSDFVFSGDTIDAAALELTGDVNRRGKRRPVANLRIEIHAEKTAESNAEENAPNATYDECDAEPVSDGRKKRKPSSLQNAQVKQLSCTMCNYTTLYTVAYELHCRKHQANEGKCGHICRHPYCLQLFGTKEELKKHKHDNKPHRYICEICGTQLKHRQSFEVHMERHVGITHYQCKYCSSTFFTLTETNAHVAIMHISEDRAKCEVCGQVFKSNKLLKQHLESHNSERNYHCTECPLSFKTQHHLSRHIKTVHEAVRFNCELCTMSYGRRDKLRLHMEKTHRVQSFFVCNICVRSFDKDEALQDHLSRHANPQELECGTCLMVCLTPETFQKHTCITYQDNYICCGRDYKNHMLYNRHMRSHGIIVNARVVRILSENNNPHHQAD